MTLKNKNFPMLYSKSSTGSLRYWIIKVKENSDGSAVIITEYGQVGGKAQIAENVIDRAKSKDTPYLQAVFEAESLHNSKMTKNGMITDVINVKDKGEILHVDTTKIDREIDIKLLPMLAKTYDDAKKNIKFPCYVQPKLDGIRYTAHMNGNAVEFRTRQDKVKPFFDFIRDEILSFNLEKHIIIDGEFYSLSIPFKNLNGICNITKVESYESLSLKDLHSIKYYIFDIINLDNPDMTFEERYQYILKNIPEGKYVKIVPCEKIQTDKEIHVKHDEYISDGYEGIMIRNLDGKYKLNHRSKDLIKLKNFKDEEYIIASCFAPTSGKDKDAIIYTLKTDKGEEFTCRPRGSIEERKEDYQNYLENPSDYIGKLYTVRFQEKYENDIPRFPVGISIRYDL